MKKINVMLANLEATTIPIGRVGENLHTQVKINCVGIFQNYPNATVSLTVQPPQGDAYPATTTRDGIYIEWDVKNSDLTTEGTGRIQLTFTDDEEVIKTVIGYTQILSSIEPTGTAPTPIENWIDEANAVVIVKPQDSDTILATMPVSDFNNYAKKPAHLSCGRLFLYHLSRDR